MDLIYSSLMTSYGKRLLFKTAILLYCACYITPVTCWKQLRMANRACSSGMGCLKLPNRETYVPSLNWQSTEWNTQQRFARRARHWQTLVCRRGDWVLVLLESADRLPNTLSLSSVYFSYYSNQRSVYWKILKTPSPLWKLHNAVKNYWTSP